ncbi:MAG: hypothetical protein COY75_07820 [Nitrospirae bacterium CG_4_10_14_0_8_um_filter_41_23]|nr:hypothetical protein [Nitrospirota bacterium]OIP59324.1 MAG: hypothetical protein AUK38_05790 [Nitrospirae bacterium CG2_30_41_42]PIQ93221.1 MAG: hypothetical protein COV68_11080 [Nitrospirae bacterium CG11_big_fil_rev_8_21_14_0_20_41_14]PIV41739.1 MAG: hypothetical protein COS27_08980 [Nitrospirae bacterium CG02_land_8_20_14_3_00_41_53]PIW86367.1 MAG: hypothetical protein COZ94_10845 [Nitrospirae bacterium CG_4_8_14_3_um_filter_41_47]PIY86485.1 MAG: hypothetical protein COY75_07820 [Nitros
MAPETEKKEEIVYKADPFAFIFRELDLMHNEIREVKVEIKTGLDATNRRIDSMSDSINKRIDSMDDSINRRIDSMSDSINKRFDRLYIIVILNLIGIVAFLIKTFFF